MSDWLLFDEHGARAEKLFIFNFTTEAVPGWARDPGDLGINVFGFKPERSWRPTWFAARMRKGWRVFELDVGEHQYADAKQTTDWWQPASPDHKRLPHIAAVEVWIRHQGSKP